MQHSVVFSNMNMSMVVIVDNKYALNDGASQLGGYFIIWYNV